MAGAMPEPPRLRVAATAERPDLAVGGLRGEALVVLDEAEAAFRKLGHADGVARVQRLREAIGERPQ